MTALVEGDETVVVTLASGSGYTVGSPASATVTIQDDDAPPVVTVTATDATAGEPGTGQGDGTFTFSRTGPTASGIDGELYGGGHGDQRDGLHLDRNHGDVCGGVGDDDQDGDCD